MQEGAGRTQGAQILHLKPEARVTSFIQQIVGTPGNTPAVSTPLILSSRQWEAPH